jgi:hypothetical protein
MNKDERDPKRRQLTGSELDAVLAAADVDLLDYVWSSANPGAGLLRMMTGDQWARASRPSFADSAISAIDTITCSGTAISPGCWPGWARRLVFWWVLLTAVPFLRRMTWSLPGTYHSAGHGRGPPLSSFMKAGTPSFYVASASVLDMPPLWVPCRCVEFQVWMGGQVCGFVDADPSVRR